MPSLWWSLRSPQVWLISLGTLLENITYWASLPVGCVPDFEWLGDRNHVLFHSCFLLSTVGPLYPWIPYQPDPWMRNLWIQRANCTMPFYIRDWIIHRFWYPMDGGQWSWNQYPVDTEGRVYTVPCRNTLVE